MLGTCGAPGPSGAHCTYLPGHSFGHFDTTRGVAWDSDDRFSHICGDRDCPSNKPIHGED